MAATALADIIVPEVWLDYLNEFTAENSAVFNSGILDSSEEMDMLVADGGLTFNVPFFRDLGETDELLQDAVDLTVDPITTEQMIAHKLLRGKAWGAGDLTKALSGSDPMGAIAAKVGTFWMRAKQIALFNTLDGFLQSLAPGEGTSLGSLDVSIADGNNATAANLLSQDETINVLRNLGDVGETIKAMALHSDIYWELVRQDFITFEPISEQGKAIPIYLGLRLIVSDQCPKVPGGVSGFVYTTYLFSEGSVAYGAGGAPVPVETDRQSLRGEDQLVTRDHYFYHPMGAKWVGTPVGTSPTNAELATVGNWNTVLERKNIKLLRLVTNG